jgi:carbon-monoxide dehydrogenase medium subunit
MEGAAMKFRDFLIPTSLDEARRALRELGDGGFPVAGGTALHFLPDQPEKTAVDITRIGLDGISPGGGAFRIGAATTVASLQLHRAKGWVLDRVARSLATQQIRNVSTIGGNIVRIFPWADFPAALLALDAVMTVMGDGEADVRADEYFKSQPSRLFKGGAMLTAVTVPALKEGAGFGYHKETVTATRFSMMTAAAGVTLAGGKIGEVRLAAGAAVGFPRRLPEIEEKLRGAGPSDEEIRTIVADAAGGMSWKGKEGMSDAYAAQLAKVVLGDVLVQAVRQAQGEGHA